MTHTSLLELVLVEDTLSDEMMALKGISSAGIPCHVTVQRDGAEALASLLDGQEPLPTLIVLDYRLPKLNGLEILTQLRLNRKTRFVPVVVFSETNAGSDMTECYRVGANSCVIKPNDPKEYVDQVACIARYWLTVNQASS